MAACNRCGKPLIDETSPCTHCDGFPRTQASQAELLPLGMTEEEPSFRRIKAGEVLDGKWRIEKKLGEGGMGTVWLATDLTLERKVAVKLLAPVYAGDKELITRFEREARMTAALEHPNIVPVYGVGHIENRPFIVMKNLEGLTVAQLIREKGSLQKDDVMPLLRQVAAGLDFIHKRNFIHRDIKSGNIFLSPDGHATILDFGILRSKGGGDAMTRTGIVMGTPHYMAPEQALGHKDVDHRADLYALAVVAFEAMTGTLPFDGDSDLSTVQMQAHSQPPDLCQRAPWVPKPVAAVVLKALSKNPADRYQTAEQFVRAIEDAYANKQQPVAPPAGTDEELQKAVKRGNGARIAFALLAALVAFGGGAAVALWPESAALPVDDLTAHPPLLAADSGALAALEPPDAGPELLTDVNALPEQLSDAGALAETEVVDAGAPVELAVVETPDAGAKVSKRPTRTTGMLNVISTFRGEPYWAAVTVNGKKMGNTPLMLDLPVGKHVIRVERAGFRTVEKRIMVASGRSDVLRIALKQ